MVGRTDDSNAAPNGNIPDAFGHGASYGVLINLWADKGFSATDLAALVGAHTVSASFAQEKNGIPPGGMLSSIVTSASAREADCAIYLQVARILHLRYGTISTSPRLKMVKRRTASSLTSISPMQQLKLVRRSPTLRRARVS